MKFSLNFMWIAATQADIPEPLIDNVIQTARAHPDVPINIWIDIFGIGNHPAPLMQDINKQNSTPTITFRALDEIPTYCNNPLFSKPHVDVTKPYDPLWQKVDLARLLALDHVIVHDGMDGAIYSDMDRKLTTRFQRITTLGALVTTPILVSALERLNDLGLVVGKEQMHRAVENQFIGVSQRRLPFFRDVLLAETALSIKEGYNGWNGHVSALKDSRLAPLGLELNDICLNVPSMDVRKAIKKQYIQNPVTSANPVYAQSSPQLP